MKPGIYQNMDFEEYKAIDAINNSSIAAATKTFAHCTIEKDPTPGMEFGKSAHTYFLEPDVFRLDYTPAPEGMKFTTKAGKEWKAEQLEDGKTVVPSADYQEILEMEKSLKSGKYEVARNLIEKSDHEVTLIWQHPKFGVLCKARVDLWVPEIGILGDLKTCTNANTDKWVNTDLRADIPIHFQPSWYLDGANILTGDKFNRFIWVLMERKAPYGITVPGTTLDTLLLAREQINRILPEYIEAKRKNDFPGYPDEITDINLPEWYKRAHSEV